MREDQSKTETGESLHVETLASMQIIAAPGETSQRVSEEESAS